MVQLIITGPTPERLKCARTLQRKLLELTSVRTALLEVIPTPRESSISFKWRFMSPEYDGFPSESDKVNEFHPLPQKMTIKWSLEDINKCNKAIDGGFISITASSQSHGWTRQDILEYTKFRLHDFIDTGALTVVPIPEYEVSQNRISPRVCRPKVQVSISKMPLSAIVPFHENGMQIPASEKAQCNEAPKSIISSRFHEGHGTSDLKLLYKQAWSHLENQYTTNDYKENYTRATLNTGLTFAIQLKEQIRRANALENENDRSKEEKDVSAASLEGEKIAEENISRLWDSAKERGRVIGVCAIEKMFQGQGIPSGITSDVRNDLSTPSLVIPNFDIGEKRHSKNALRRFPPICADESRDKLSKACAPHPSPPSNPASPVDMAVTSPEDFLPTIANFKSQNSRYQIAITNASVQIPPATNAFHESFLNRIFGPINHTLNIVPPSQVINPVQWTRFFTINLDTQPYIFPPSTPIQTYGQIVHVVSQATAESPRASQGTTYPTLLRFSQDTDEYHYIGHFVADDQTNKPSTSSTTLDKASQTGYLSEPHEGDFTSPDLKVPTAPKAMRSDHSTIEVQTLSGSIQRDFIPSSLSQTINIPKGPALMMRVYPPTSDKEAPRQSNPTGLALLAQIVL
ncbi:hypothetical protein BHYA_0007g00260 [Botrytis hyacinthi]|uniref:Uncharacterized protein n=1 Tax=Botrytis hyacinthi TaxID=278943 RepID=A0A4Z1HBW0_9HELO|nr:hypothetical protein BHYA_0007g00260 [Botrytis hyacinthi]